MTTRTARLAAALALGLVVTALGGCERQVSGPVLVLRLASPDREQDATGEQVLRFAAEVAERSDGTIRIEPVWDVTTDDVYGWDQVVARGVADGRWDLGLVPGRAWDELGVRTLRALNAPFLVTSRDALEAVLDSDLRAELLSGLPRAGVVGLDLFPDGLRHPFGNGAPLLGVEDYDGATIRSAESETVARLFAAYGATTTDAQPDGSTQRGAESDYGLSASAIATGNVTFFAKTEVLALDATVFDRIRPDQRAVLTEAAAATRRWLLDHQPSDTEAAADFCERGGSVVAASDEQLRGLEDAAEPVTAWLRRDADTRRLLDAVAGTVSGIDGPAPVTACPTTAPDDVTDPELASLNGTYTSRVTARQLRAAGVTDPEKVRENSGRMTWVLDDGDYVLDTEARHFIAHPHLVGRYTYRDSVFTFFWGPGPGAYTTARLEVATDGTITFHDVVDGDPAEQATSEGFFQPLTRVGGVPD